MTTFLFVSRCWWQPTFYTAAIWTRCAASIRRHAFRRKKLYDGVDYMPMPRWRVFLIQLLNIAGIGPIFGAVMGACFRSGGLLWITFGGIFLGAMHDYISGVIILRHDGKEPAGGGGHISGQRRGTRAEVVLAGAADTGGRGIPAFAGSHTLRHDRHVDVSLAGRYRRLLLRGHAHAHRQDHRPRLSGVRGLRSS